MPLLPYQVAESGERLQHFCQDALFSPQHPFISNEQINTLKVAAASYELFTSLFLQFQRKQLLPPSASTLQPSDRLPGFTRSHRYSTLARRHPGPLFRRGGRVRLADGSVQKIEGLKIVDFLRTAMSLGGASLLQWVEIERIFVENSPVGGHRGVVKIRFSLYTDVIREDEKNYVTLPTSITFDHICGQEQPFFVRFHGWASCNPYSTQTKYGMSCRQLSVRDFCLVVVPPEIATSHAPRPPHPPAGRAPPSDGRSKAAVPAPMNQTPPSFLSQPELSTFMPPQPLDLKKEGCKKTQGTVPKYFTAISLAESPFKATK